ncbi:MAG TPA: hypothetical protein VKE25_14385 [Actinomycetes bacterium]|nr:hypothetical protein [Actinomycetes bacterium]
MREPIVIPDATTEPDAYVAALLDTLGERDPIEVYAGTPEAAKRLCAPLDGAGWLVPLAPGQLASSMPPSCNRVAVRSSPGR